jgi:hypothetical protein
LFFTRSITRASFRALSKDLDTMTGTLRQHLFEQLAIFKLLAREFLSAGTPRPDTAASAMTLQIRWPQIFQVFPVKFAQVDYAPAAVEKDAATSGGSATSTSVSSPARPQSRATACAAIAIRCRLSNNFFRGYRHALVKL